MKQGTVFTRIAMLIILLALVGYLAVTAWRGLTDPFSTTLAYSYTEDDGAEVEGILVREEQVLPGQTGIVDLRVDEGERVGVGQAVAYLYQSEEAVARQQTIRALTLEAEQLRAAMTLTDTGDAARLDETIIRQTVELRSAAAQKDFTALEDQVLDLKSTVLQRAYTYGQEGTGALQTRLTELRGEIDALRSQAERDTRAVTAPASGTFSALVDGYEGVVTPDSLADLTPASLAALLEREEAEDPTALGKLITDPTWYFAALVPEEIAGRLLPGHQVTLRFSRDFSGDLSATVESVGEGEGQVVVIHSSQDGLARTTLLRMQMVELIFDSRTGLRVPKQAVHLTEETVTDPDTGEEETRTVYGVYAVVGTRAEFKPVEILEDSGEFYLVTPVASDKTALRAGDEIVISARDLYDGKVVG